ncbi:hypothetical protein D9611_009338 [Ephemerocybe angulata]|uniref:Uncharacterized protein n=1 Tax=Ephemerocybe angulata TaxID=980116 RepID=A0A8H5BJ19_9AGAR|nr:hypothetical protein D9611_009338 [Tulosesus angulatus]
MTYNSPFLNPDTYIGRIASLSNEAITIDKGVAQATRDAAEFATKYSSDFSLVNELKTNSAIAGLKCCSRPATLHRPFPAGTSVFLSLVGDIASDGDARDVVTEFNSLINEDYPTVKYKLDDAPGVKNSFVELEQLVTTESNHVIQVLQSNDWKAAVAKLNENLDAVKNGVQGIRKALNQYATKLE